MGFFHSLLLTGTKPENPLEQTLLAFLKGKAPIEPFLQALVHSKVFVLIKGSGDLPPAQILPLVIAGAGGVPAVCIFTSPQRSEAIAKGRDELGQGVEIEFRALLNVIPPGYGIIVNAGTLFSTEAPPIAVEELRGVTH